MNKDKPTLAEALGMGGANTAVIEYDETSEGGGISDGHGDSDFPDLEDEDRTVELIGAYITERPTGFQYEPIEIGDTPHEGDPEEIYVIVRTSTTYDTFQTVHGAWELVRGYYDPAKADAKARKLNATARREEGFGESNVIYETRGVPIRG